jgi:histidyl-tRNA synthetase
MFRHERPQKGRYRQFHQIDAEALGFEGPDVDAEQIVMLSRLWKALDLPGIELHINSIGNAHERLAHRNELVAYLEHHADVLDANARRRLHENPLRILDSKNPAMQPVLEAAPKLIDFIEDKSLAHFEALQTLLRDAGLSYQINPRLVRGLEIDHAPAALNERPGTLRLALVHERNQLHDPDCSLNVLG